MLEHILKGSYMMVPLVICSLISLAVAVVDRCIVAAISASERPSRCRMRTAACWSFGNDVNIWLSCWASSARKALLLGVDCPEEGSGTPPCESGAIGLLS